jgi:predicted RNase H-like HicB family nuclease
LGIIIEETQLSEVVMTRHFALEYWVDDNWYVGRIKEVPGVFSQGETLTELENNIRDAYKLMMEDEITPDIEGRQVKDIEVAV